LLERLPLRIVKRVGHHDRHGGTAGFSHREDPFAPDDGVTDDLDQFFVDLQILDPGNERQIRELGDKLGRVLAAELELRVQHALHQRGGVLGHFLKEDQVFLFEPAVGAGVDLLVEQLDCSDDDVGLQRHGQHRAHLEARVHLLEREGFRSIAREEQRLAGVDDFADISRALRQRRLEQLFGQLLELQFLGLVVSPKCGRVVDVPEVDLVALEKVQGHRLTLQLVDPPWWP